MGWILTIAAGGFVHATPTLKQLPISENNPEDIDTEAEDHLSALSELSRPH
jgi:hypothetical protein